MTEQDIFAFVLMPFSPTFDDIYRLGIKEPSSQLGIRCERVDEQVYAEGILERIYRQIESADLIIADMSQQNPNVFYEVGYAHARGKLCLLLTSNSNDIPFDLKHRRHIVYGTSIQSLREQLVKDIQWAKSEITNVRKSRIRVSASRISGDLEKTKYSATAKISFEVDLHNDSDLASAEIEAIYFYTGQDWHVSQNDAQCPSTASDIPGFKNRYFLNSPIKRLQRSGWAQLRFRTDRVVGFSTKGDELKDSYPISGQSIVRLVTDKGSFDYEIVINTTADAFLF